MDRFATVNGSEYINEDPQNQYDNQEVVTMEHAKTPEKCEEIQIRFLTAPDDPEIAAHMAECEECASFALFHDTLISTSDRLFDTPELPVSRHKIFFSRRVWISACAAAFAVCTGTFVFLSTQMPGNNTSQNTTIMPVMAQQYNNDAYNATYAVNDQNAQSDSSSEVSLSWDASDEAQMIEALQQEFDTLYANNADWKIQEYTPYFAME